MRLLSRALGIDLQVSNECGRSPIMQASRDNQLEVVKVLLEAPGVGVNAVDNGWTPLHSFLGIL